MDEGDSRSGGGYAEFGFRQKREDRPLKADHAADEDVYGDQKAKLTPVGPETQGEVVLRGIVT